MSLERVYVYDDLHIKFTYKPVARVMRAGNDFIAPKLWNLNVRA